MFIFILKIIIFIHTFIIKKYNIYIWLVFFFMTFNIFFFW